MTFWNGCPGILRAIAVLGLGTLLAGRTGALDSAAQHASNASRDASSVRKYSVADLGPLQIISSDVMPGLNSSGQVVLWRETDSETFVPALDKGNAETRLSPPKGYSNSFAYSVNDQGNSVGWSNTTLNPVDSSSTVHASFFTDKTSVDLGTLGGTFSKAYAINNHNEIVGISETADHSRRGFRYAGSHHMEPLEPLPDGDFSVAFDINDDGIAVGGSAVPTGSLKPTVHAVFWRKDVPVDIGVIDPKGNTIAYAINNHAEIVGTSEVRSEETVFLYSGGQLRDLGIHGHAFGINDRRQIVGSLEPAERKRPKGFLWENGELYDLNTLLADQEYTIEAAFRINNKGQILCKGYGNGHLRFLLLTPVPR